MNGCSYHAYGNIHLLEDYDIANVKISQNDSPELLKKKKLKRVRNWSIDNGGRLILIIGNGFAPRYSPMGMWHELCNQGRLLIIAPTTHSTANIKYTRQMCEDMNNIASEIAKGKIRRI